MAEVLGRRILNEAALRRLDPCLNKVVDFAKFVAVYTFTLKENKWEKTEIEGTLFLYSRTVQPFYNILVLNRLSLNNLVEPVCSKLIFQVHDPFLLYLNCKCALYGIWFYEKDECGRIASLLEKLLLDDAVVHQDSVNHSSPLSDGSICNILLRAEQAYKNTRDDSEIVDQGDRGENEGAVATLYEEEEEDEGAGAGLGAVGDQKERKRAVVLGGEEVCNDDEEDDDEDVHDAEDEDEDEDETPQSVMDFFARVGCASINAQMGLMPGMMSMDGDDSERAAMNPLIHQIITNPHHSVEHIERQQRLASLQKQESARAQKQKSANAQKPESAIAQQTMSANAQDQGSDKERLLNSILRTGKKNTQREDGPDPDQSLFHYFSQLQKCSSTYQPPTALIPESLPPITLMPEPLKPVTLMQKLPKPITLMQDLPKPVTLMSKVPKPKTLIPEVQKPITLMTPSMFTSPIPKTSENDSSKNYYYGGSIPVVPPTVYEEDDDDEDDDDGQALTYPIPFAGVQNRNCKVQPLTKKQLFQTFNYLLHHDPTFMNRIYESYLMFLTDKLS